MNWDTFYKQFQAKQPQITWDEYYKTLPIKAPVYTTEMLYNTQAKPKTKFTETDFQPLNIEWKFDWSQYGSYDETDPTDQLRKIRNVPPYSIVSTYDFSDSEDKKRFEEGLPSKALESRILSTQARKEARAYLQERQRLFEDLLKQKQSEKILGIFPKPKVQKIEPKDYTPAEIPPTVAAWLGYQEALKTYQQEIEDLKKYEPKTYAYKELIGTLPKPPEPPMFEPPEEFQYLEKDLWEEYIKKQEEERRRQEEEKRKARQTTAIPATRTTEPPSTTPQPIQPSGIETLKRIAERYPVTLSGPVYRAQQEVTQPQESKEQSPGKKILEDFFKLDKKTVDKFAQNVRKVHISDKVTWGDVFKNAVKAGMIKMGSSWAKTGKTLLGWLPDNIENALIYGGVPYEKMQEDYDRMLAEIETEMKESAPVQKFIYTGASESIPLLTNYLLASFMSAPVAAKPATVAGKIGKAAIQTASKLPYTAYFYGSYAREAEREGATPEQQLLYGIVGATIETVTEAPIVERMLGKGISTTLMNKMMKTGGKTLINRLGRIGMETLFNIGMETGQEIIAGIGSTFAKQMIYEPDTKLSWQQVGEDAYGGLAMATVLSALGLPVRYNAHKMAETLIDNASKGEKVTTDQIIQLAEQTQQDLNDMTAKDKAELTKTVNEEAKTVDEVLRLPMPSPENVARMQFDTAINNIREQLIAYTTKTDLDVTTRQNIRNTVINNINLATELNKQYGFELPNYIRNAAQILEQQPSVETIEVPASEQAVTQQPAPSRYTQYIGQQVTLKPPYGNVTVKGETDTHVIVDKQGEEKRILKNAFSRLIEQEPAPLPEQVQDEIPADSVRVLPVNAINVDPARFQFKADVESKTGASRTLDIKKWDPYLAGVVLVWQDNNGRYWVVNGHHRLQKAKELGVDTINVHVIREADGYSDKDARELGAKINIAEGHGTLTDAAKLFRDGGYTLEQIQEEGLPLRSGNALKGLHLAQLNDNLFDKVITKQLTEEKGAIIGEILPTDKGGINDAKQNYIWNKIKDARVSADEVREMAEMLKDADAKPRTEQTLLGEWLVWDIADFDIKPKLIADTKSVLISNKNAFNKVLKNSKALQEAGNVLVEGENIRRRDLLSQAVAIVDRGKNLKGHPINDILNIYTEQIKAGMSKSTAAEKAANEIVELIASGKYFEQMKKELQAAKVKTGEQIDMLGGIKSEVEERDSQQGERVSQDTGEIQAADTEAAATAEARTTSPKEPWQMTKDEFIQNVLDKKYDFPRLGTKGEMMSKYVDAYKNTLKRDPETAEIALSRIKEAATNEHKANILEAIVEGKPVPEEILKDYPDIQQGAQVSGTEPETQDIKPKQTVEPKKSSISANEYTENLYQAIVSNGQNLLTEGGIFYGKEGALRLAREYGYGLANYPEKEASDTIQSSYGRLCVRLYALQPPISAKEWVKEIEKGIKQAKSKLQEKKMSTQEGHRESVIDETKILTPEQLIELNQQMIEKGQPITRDSVGYNKLDFYFAYSLSKETQLSNKQLASLANTLAKYGKTQLNIDPQILKNTAEHYRKLSEAGTIPISIQHQPSGGNEWIAEIAGRDEKYKYKRKFLKPAKREWSSTGKTGITIFRLEEGKIYEINEPYKGRRFVKVENGEIKPIEQGEVAQSSVKVQSFQRRITQGSVLTSRVMEQQIAKGEIGEPVKRSEIEQFVREKFDIPIGYGKFRQRVAGIYKVHPEVIRLKKPKDIEVLFHEVGHFLDDKLKLTSSQFAGELLELGKPSSRESYTKIQVMEEGVAEFVRLYTIVPEEAKAKAPQFYQYFKTRLAQNREFEDVLKTLQVATENYIKQDPVERVLSNIDFGEKTIGKKLDTSRLYTLMFDELHGLKKATDMIVGNEKIATSANPFELAWLHRGWQGKAEVFLEHGVLDENFKKVYKSFDEIIKPVKNNLREFSAYATAKRAQELHDRGIETGLLDSDIKAILERFKNKGYDKVLNELVEYQNNVLYETLVKSGRLSQEAYTAMTEINKHYVPFYRVMENVGTGTGKGFQTYQPIRRIKGSQRDIVDPLSSIIKNVYLFTNIASRNNVGKALADLAEQYKGSGKVIDKVPPRVIPHKVVLSQIEKVLTDVGVDVDTIDLDAVATFFTPTGYSKKDKVITIYKNGKPEYYEVFADDVYRAFLALDQEQTNTVIKLLSYPAKALRVGATTLSPEFALGRNPVRDTILAAITSKNNFIPVFDTVRGLYHVLGKTDEYYKLKAAGAMNSTLLSLDRNSLRRKLEEFADKGPKEQLKTVVTTPLRLLIAMTDAFEESTRVGAGLKALKKQGAEREGYLKAALEARDITVDFLRFGTATKQANKIIAFFNVAFQGAEKVYRSFREDPLGSTIRSFMYITLPSIALWFINRDDERYKELPGWQRDLFWIIPGGKHMWRIPKPPLLGQLFGSFVERALTAVYDEDKKAFEGFFDNFVSDLLPNVIPTALLPVIEIVSNYDFFREYPVVPASEQQLEPPQQYGHYTSEFAKWIGETFYVSPRKVDHLIQGYTGRLGTSITDLIDLFVEVTGIKESKAPAKTTAETLPVVRGFVADTHRSYSVDQFYKKYKELERKYATARVKDKAMNLNRFEEGGKLRAMRKTVDRLAKLRQRIEEIYNDPHLSPERKQEEIEALQKEMTELAKEALK